MMLRWGLKPSISRQTWLIIYVLISYTSMLPTVSMTLSGNQCVGHDVGIDGQDGAGLWVNHKQTPSRPSQRLSARKPWCVRKALPG